MPKYLSTLEFLNNVSNHINIVYLMASVRYMEVTIAKLPIVIMGMKTWERNHK
jgi:hypothetical protein